MTKKCEEMEAESERKNNVLWKEARRLEVELVSLETWKSKEMQKQAECERNINQRPSASKLPARKEGSASKTKEDRSSASSAASQSGDQRNVSNCGAASSASVRSIDNSMPRSDPFPDDVEAGYRIEDNSSQFSP